MCCSENSTCDQSLISLAIVNHPPGDMLAARIVVRPMDDPALHVPDVLTIKTNGVAYVERTVAAGVTLHR